MLSVLKGQIWCFGRQLTVKCFMVALVLLFLNLIINQRLEKQAVLTDFGNETLYTLIVFCIGQCEFLWTLKTIFTEAFRLM
jgi:hypothetical protein